ncbi:predicted protein, partial [Nematostella vectensis]
PTHCTTQAVPRDHLHSEPCTNTLHHKSCTYEEHTSPHKLYLGTTCTVSHAPTHCTTQAVPRDHLHKSHVLTHCTTQAVPRDHLHSETCTNTLHHTSCT